MEKIPTVSRIHPLMAAAAVAVIVVSAAGTAAVAGWLPGSKAEPAPSPLALSAEQSIGAQRALEAQQASQGGAQAAPQLTPATLQYQQGAPLDEQRQQPQQADYAPAPVHHSAHHHVHHTAHAVQTARNDSPSYAAAPVAQPRQPNYLGIGAGAVIGGLIGHQVGGGNGKKLATVAGVIGGGLLGNEIANRNR